MSDNEQEVNGDFAEKVAEEFINCYLSPRGYKEGSRQEKFQLSILYLAHAVGELCRSGRGSAGELNFEELLRKSDEKLLGHLILIAAADYLIDLVDSDQYRGRIHPGFATAASVELVRAMGDGDDDLISLREKYTDCLRLLTE